MITVALIVAALLVLAALRWRSESAFGTARGGMFQCGECQQFDGEHASWCGRS